jgi:hypothetical protein
MKTKQQGAALVIVLALMTGALVVGVSGMQSSLIDERLAGNYRASAQAQMNAEQAAGEAATLGSQKYSTMSEFANDKGSNWDELGLDEDDWQDELTKLRYEEDVLKEMSDREDNLCGEGENVCFYFPLQVGSDNYMVAFGAVIKEGAVISQHVVLVKLQGGVTSSFPTQEIIDKFREYGILSGDEVDIDVENGKLKFSGRIHGDGNNGGDKEGWEEDDVILEGEGSAFSTGASEKVDVPDFDFEDFFVRVNDGYLIGNVPGDSGCDIESSRNLNNETQYCSKNVDIDGGVTITDSTVYFNDDVDVDGSLAISNSTIYFDKEVEIDGALTVVNSTIISRDDIDFGDDDNPGGLALTNVVMVSGKDIDIDASYSPTLENVLVMAQGEIEIDLKKDAQINGGWFYSGDDGAHLEVDIEDSPEMIFCGALMARGDVDFDADPPIKRFNSSGRNGCPEFGDFDGLLEGDSGELKFDEWE